ncbi:MAG TPA: hypothetical protein VMU84_02585 [Thermoanaerobaculia bacterium]|nr:hypothetical protein [Thermoanaerobaculia bacterium]
MNERRSRDEAVFDRHRVSGRSKVREQLSPTQARLCFPRQANEPLNTRFKPALEVCPAFSAREKKNAESKLAEDDRVNGDLSLVPSQPPKDRWIGRRLGRFAQDVGIDQISHSVSVDSESIATK